MVGWSCLPPKIKQNVVKKLDFMSRHSLKNVCHADRLIVNSTPSDIPCVRFGYKQEKCLIVIYTGIEKFLRMEFSKNGQNGIIIHKSENSMDPKLIVSKTLSTAESPLDMSISILKSLIGHESILIKTMEFDIAGNENTSYFLDIFSKRLKNVKFRVEVITQWKDEKKRMFKMTDVFGELCVWEQLKHLRYISFIPAPDNLVPVITAGSYVTSFHFNKPAYFQAFYTRGFEYMMRRSEMIPLSHNPLEVTTPFFFYAAYRKPAKDSKEDIYVEYKNSNNFTIYRQSSECGQWFRKVPEQYEEDMKQWKTQKCGLGVLCSKCADPFEHWYNQMLPRRLFHEPFWAENMMMDDDIMKNDVRLLRNELAMDEKKREKIRKGMKIQKASNTSSWGFKQISIDSLMTPFEVMKRDKNQKKKMNKKKKKLGLEDVKQSEDKPEDVKEEDKLDDVKEDSLDSEDVNNSKDIQKSEDVKEDQSGVKVEDVKSSEVIPEDVNSDAVVNVEEIPDNDVYLTASEDEEEVFNDVIDVKPSTTSNQFSTWTMAILLVSLAFNLIVIIIYFLM